ncbi:PRC-barrel domain-containing protein [Streptomyces sp. NPDC001793]|uniref:PRC-barrel domain-containing protein n=1 Tax=Streptomyces sp. NPDC001793 TaxID=3154657 RepID=UPI00332F20BD
MDAPMGGTPQSLTGLRVVDAEGAKVGVVQQVYRDDATDEPEWITVRTGLLGLKETFVPLAGARRAGDELHVPHTKGTMKAAPRIDAEGHLDPSEEERLYRHYGLLPPGPAGPAGPTEPPGTSG